MERKRRHPSDDDDDVTNNDDFDENGPRASQSAGSGLALLNAYEWRDVAQFLRFHENTILRYASGALNRLIDCSSSTLPLRVIAALVAGHVDEGYGACGFEADLRTPWRDLLTDVHASPESMLHDILTRCQGLVIARLDLRKLPYDDKVVEALTLRLASVTVPELILDGIASGHENVHRLLEIVPGLRAASLSDDVAHPNAAAFLGVCATQRIPNATLRYAADVTDAQIIEYLFSANSAGITRQFGIANLRRSLSENFFEMIVERCRHDVVKALRFGVAGILTDPSDAQFERFVAERDDNAAMYRFQKVDPTEASFTVLVGTSTATGRFYLRVFQGDYDDLCTSLSAAKVIFTCRMALLKLLKFN